MSSLIIAAAGAGKTTFLVDQALKIPENILITTYTDANEQSIVDIYQKNDDLKKAKKAENAKDLDI